MRTTHHIANSHCAMDSTSVNEQSEYEKLRLSNIQRNEEYLRNLGFEQKTDKVRPRAKVASSKRKRDEVQKEVVEPTRRSSRVAVLPPVSYTEPSLPQLSTRSRSAEGPDNSNDISTGRVDGDLTVGETCGVDGQNFEVDDTVASNSGTSSSMQADIAYFLGDLLTDVNTLGTIIKHEAGTKKVKKENADEKTTINAAHRLCAPVEQYGKAAVMALSNHGKLPRFSKYSGALEWLNCVYLWVNIGGTSGYSNAFSEHGRHMMWYGGSKMHQESKIVKRIANARKPDADSKAVPNNRAETVILFVRLEGENYCCLGRLQWVAIDLLSSPVKVKWELIDYDTFVHTEHFKRVLKHGGLS